MAEAPTLFRITYYNSRVGKIAIVTMDNGEDFKKPNTFGEKALASLQQAADAIEADKDIKGVMLCGKHYIFAAGADLMQVPFINTFEQGRQIGAEGHAAMKRIKNLSVPTLAAINGAALGGGFEISLYCDFRTVSKAVTAIAFPECFLGLIPGWGGCSLTPRLIGPEKALELIVYNPLNQNRMINGTKAFEMGLADRLFDSVEFFDESLLFLEGIIDGSVKVERPAPDTSKLKSAVDAARNFVDMRVHGAAPAPYRAIELVESACDMNKSLDECFAGEDKALGDLIKSRQCKAGVYSFDLVQRRAKKPVGVPKDVRPRAINKIGIVGAGLMASQLAVLFLRRYGVPVVMKDIKQEFLDKGLGYVKGEFASQVSKGKMTQAKADHLFHILIGTLDWNDFADCDFVIEAVFEEMGIKQEVFAQAEAVVSPTCVLATNTSSLSLTEMASKLKNPERVVGFHFFNPVAILPLLEIIKGEKTDDVTLATAFDCAKKLRKNAILVKDSPAFLVNRLLTKLLSDCFEIVDEGADFTQVDDAALMLGLPMAPFELLTLVGPAVGFHVGETLHKAWPDRFPINEHFRQLVEAKMPAVYQGFGPGKQVLPKVKEIWANKGDKEFLKEEILDRLLTNMTTEIDLILKEKVVPDPKDIDTAMILGAGWPFFNGGITLYLDMVGYTPKVLQKVFFSI
ncbi:MAG TPA: 3-hydroxyacyl-CoA dehydrogenase NAD-binding domain-containing protein [Desulfomonilaceae bacterium]|nr:3-hydroxyacyl-CoA dehydrogenase NAD-binding domain-containing protein [Desulfomonilaceae bacterium]